MKIEIYAITESQAPELLRKFVAYSVPALVAVYGEVRLAYFGFIPQTILSTDAYLWLHTTEEAARHRLIFARESRNVVERMMEKYERVFGHCFTPAAQSWLRWAGAEVSGTTFEFRRAA